MSLNKNELRNGNIVKGQCGYVIVDWNSEHFRNTVDYYCSPMTIDSEWLDWLGFERRNFGHCIEQTINVPNEYGGRIVGMLWDGKFTVRLEGCDEGQVGENIEHLHQLQNLYFALTGEELTVKDTVNRTSLDFPASQLREAIDKDIIDEIQKEAEAAVLSKQLPSE